MNYPDETIYQALFDLLDSTLLQGARAWQTSSRKWQTWENASVPNQPALFIREGNQQADQDTAFGLTRWKLRATAWIYCQHPSDQGSIPSTLINNLLSAVKLTLNPYPSDRPQTLGGLVANCYIEGRILVDEGLAPMDTQSIVVIPISILTGD